MSKEINSYPKIYNFGHRAIRDIFNEPVVAQEKVDGSQFSFMVDENDDLHARSKGATLYFDNPEKMFRLGLESVATLYDNGLLTKGWIYRGEYLQKPKHNVIEYKRVPNGHIILFDIQIGQEHYLTPESLAEEAAHIGLESVPCFGYKKVSLDDLKEFLLRESVLGGAGIEGVVVKNYTRFDEATGKALMAKHVSEAFKEVHRNKSYKTTNKDVIASLVEHYKTEARWQKAVQHLRERGELLEDPKDIGRLIKEVNVDVLEECKEEIMEALFKWGWKQVSRGITAGLPEWYKEQLLEKQFPTGPDVY